MRPSVIILLFSLLQPVLGETQRAEQLYTSQGCAACHQINQPVDPNKVMVGPPLAAVGSHYANDPKALETILTSFRHGSQGQVGAERDAAAVSPDQRERRTTRRMDSHSEEAGGARWRSQGRRAYTRVCFPQPLDFRESGWARWWKWATRLWSTASTCRGPRHVPSPWACPRNMGGISYAFDAAECRLLYVWSGGFHRHGESLDRPRWMVCQLLGEKIYQAPSHFPLRIGKLDDPEKPELAFKGYRMVEGSPSFSIRWMVRTWLTALSAKRSA